MNFKNLIIKIVILLIVSTQASFIAIGQNIEQYVEYARPVEKGFLLHFYKVSEDYKVAASDNEVFLLNSQNIAVDTLKMGNNYSSRNPIQKLAILSKSTFSIANMQKALLVKINNDNLIIEKELDINNTTRKKYNNADQIIVLEEGLIAYNNKWKKNENKTVVTYYDSNDNPTTIFEGCNIENKNFNNKSYATALYQDYFDGKVLLNFPDCNKVVQFNYKGNLKVIQFDYDLMEQNSVAYLLRDWHMDKEYLIVRNVISSESKLFLKENGKLKNLGIIKQQILDISNGRFHTIGALEGDIAHYYYPIDKLSEHPLFQVLEDINIIVK